MHLHPPTPEDILLWRMTAAKYRPRITPNRRSADEIASYLAARYPVIASDDPRLHDVVAQNILRNDFFARKIPAGANLATRVYLVQNEGTAASLYNGQEPVFQGNPIIVGLEDHTHFFLVEGSGALHDELTAFAGLDEDDLKNDYCVAEYVGCVYAEELQILTDIDLIVDINM